MSDNPSRAAVDRCIASLEAQAYAWTYHVLQGTTYTATFRVEPEEIRELMARLGVPDPTPIRGQWTCPACRTSTEFEVNGAGSTVVCRGCGGLWRIELPKGVDWNG